MLQFEIDKIPISTIVQGAAQALEAGRLIIYPTDTVYGLGADALNLKAVQRIRGLKGRDPNVPFSVVMRDSAMIKEYCRVSKIAETILGEYLPGPFTLILPLRDERIQTSSTGKVGIRIPKSALTQALSKVFGRPYVTTSANLTHTPPLTTVKEILEQFGSKLTDQDMVIGAGTLLDLPSTVVDLTTPQPTLLRQGVGVFHP